MSNKKQILNSIAAVAKQLGRAPSQSEFGRRTGITDHCVSQFFPRWNAAVRAAGLRPSRVNARRENSELLKDWGKTARKKRAAPSRREYLSEGKYDHRTIENRFGSWSSVPEAFRQFAKGKREWADVVALLPARMGKEQRKQPRKSTVPSILPPKAQHAALKDRANYGNPMDFGGLRHEPVNEQGVVFLFGMVAKELGYLVEAMQRGFPDCEAKRQVEPGRWQRVNIEFEFESKNFREHGHPLNGCDVIVCWRHNWDDCPKHIEILELSSTTKSLAKSENGQLVEKA